MENTLNGFNNGIDSSGGVGDHANAVISDSQMLDWLQNQMTPKEGYCEIFFAGLRSGDNDASAFQIESNPENFPTLSGPTLREVIKCAMLAKSIK